MAKNRDVNISNFNFIISQPKPKKDDSPRIVFSVIALILAVFLIFCVFKKVISGTSLSFASFLNYLGSTSIPSINLSIGDFTIYGNWGVFEFLRIFLNLFTGPFGVIVFLCSNVINLFLFVFFFVGFLFV